MYPVVGSLVIAAALLAVVGPQLPILQMGDDAAGALGIRPERVRLAYFGIGVG